MGEKSDLKPATPVVVEMDSAAKDKKDQSKPDKKGCSCSCLQKASNVIIGGMEKAFYKLGWNIGKRPWFFILGSLLGAALCGLGMLNFRQTTTPENLWVPTGSTVLSNKDWVDTNFPSTTRYLSLIVTADNVLTSSAINSMLTLYQSIATSASTSGYTLTDVCEKAGSDCLVTSVLELWSYNATHIASLSTSDIVDAVNSITTSPMYGSTWNKTSVLGDRTTNTSGDVISAKAASMYFLLLGNESMATPSAEWEAKAIEVVQQGVSGLQLYVFATRSFGDEAGKAISGDVTFLSAGYMILIVFIFFVLGNYNAVEQRVWLSLGGIICVGLSILVSFGLASAFGAEYGPVHTILPFLLLGIGVDDMFVIVGALNTLTAQEREKGVEEKVAITLKHAGVSVTVTSITDFVAFAIGASTVLPALRSFCAFACLGVLGLYLLQTILFTSLLAIDLRRAKASRNACCCCYVHQNYRPNACSQRQLLTSFFRRLYGPFLVKLPAKIGVVVVTLALLAVNLYGLVKLKQEFDPAWFLPTDSYATSYTQASQLYFPSDGASGNVYCGAMDYWGSQTQMERLYTDVSGQQSVDSTSLDSWFLSLTTWLATSTDASVTSRLDGNKYPLTSDDFVDLTFTLTSSQQPRLSRYMSYLNSTGGSIQASYIPYQHVTMDDSYTEIVAMDNLYSAISAVGSPVSSSCFAYARVYLTWETNKVIQEELYRNIGLAFLCVFLVTLVLIANIWTSCLVSSCVALTLVDVGGSMYFWGLTIDTVSSIILIIAIGLAVDYSAHVGHTFMTIKGTKNERCQETLAEMGPPVCYGGFSTFLAFVLLAGSTSYVFTTFFKVFLLVVGYGLFHGLVYLPVILSWMGPEPYPTADREFEGVEGQGAGATAAPGSNPTPCGQPNGSPPPAYATEASMVSGPPFSPPRSTRQELPSVST